MGHDPQHAAELDPGAPEMTKCVMGWSIVAMLIAGAFAPEAWADAATDAEIERAKKKQDRVLKSYKRRKDERGLALFAEQERQRAERESAPLKDWLAGRALHFAKKKLQAHKYLSRAWSKDQRMWPAGLRLGLMYMEDKRCKEALHYIRNVLRVRPNEVTALQMLVECCLKEKRWAEAIPPLQTLQQKSPDDPRILDALGRCYLELQDYQSALTWTQRLASLPQAAADPGVLARMAECHTKLQQWPEARAVAERLKQTPAWGPNPILQKQLVMILFQLKETVALERELSEYVGRVPDDLKMQELLLQLYFSTKSFDKALMLARSMRGRVTDPEMQQKLDAQVLVLLLQKKDDQGALAQIRKLRAEARTPERRTALDGDLLMLLLRLRQFDEALAHAKVMRQAEQDLQRQAALSELIGRLERGEDPTKPVEREAPDPNNPYVKLVKRCIHEDVAVRRKALREYFEMNLPLVDPIVYQRFSPDIEPDPECRVWVIRILGRFDMTSMSEPEYAREVAKRLAVSLEDPDSEVRRIGAEELGGLSVPAGLIYLLPHLYRIDLDTKPANRDAQKVVEREYNAVRKAIVTLSGHNELTVLEGDWISFERAKANREVWDKWLDSADADAAKIAALQDLQALEMEGQPGPRAAWFLRFCLDHCFRPSRWPVAIAAYKLLRDTRAPEADGAYGTLWKGFPVYDDARLSQPIQQELETALKGWWSQVAKQPGKGGRAAPPKDKPARSAPEPPANPPPAASKGAGTDRPK